jgi:predicted DNA-binding transcriptional regulator YafY
MPLNKEAFIRYRILDQCLSNKKKPFPKIFDFMRAYEEVLGKSFSQRTINLDLQAMRDDMALGFMAPIKYSRQYNGYYYEDENYSISSIKLSETELDSIGFATKVLQQYKGIGLFNQFDEAVDKIMNAISIKNILTDKEETEIIQLEKIHSFKGSEWLNIILNAIKNHEVINISYKKFSSDEMKELVVHPYLLKEYRNRWYMIGMTDRKKLVSTYGLDRIDKIVVLPKEKFIFSPDFNASIYFKHAYGITTFEGKPHKVQLRFENNFAKYILTQPMHETQKVLKQNAQNLDIEIEVGITPELIQDILSYGNKVQVLRPKILIEQIKKSLEDTTAHYI